MSQIGVATLVVKASSVQLQTDLDKASARVTKFAGDAEKSIKRLESLKPHEMGEKMTSAFGRMRMVSSTFDAMRTDAEGFAKAIAVAEGTVGSLTLGLSAASKMASGLKGVMLGTGIGLAIAGVGALISWATSPSRREREAERMTSGLSDTSREFLTGAGVTTASRFEMTRSGMARRVSDPTVTDRDVELARGVPSLRELASASTLASSGSTREATTLRTAESTVHAGIRAADATPAFAAFREEVERTARAFRMAEGSRFVGALGDARDRARDASATMGMSAAAADEYGLMMRTTTRRVGDFTISTRESLTPAEAHARRLEEIARAELDAGVAAGAFADRREDSRRTMLSEVVALGELRDARLRADSAAETSRVADPFVAAGREMSRISDLFVRGGIDAATFGRGVESTLGVARRPARALADELMRIDEIETRAAGAAGLAGVALDTRPFEEARRAAREALVPPEASDVLSRRLEDVGDAFRRGSISAEEFGRATRDALTGAFGDTRTAQERLADSLRMIDAAGVAAAGADGADLADISRRSSIARARALMSSAGGMRLDMPGGVAALERGSVEAVRAINEARRAAPSDPVERLRAAMEANRRIEEETRDATRRVAEAMDRGLFREFGG